MITSDDLSALNALLKPIVPQWSQLGVGLGVSYSYLQSLRMSNNSIEDKLTDMIYKWIQSRCSSVTWEHLIEVLKSLDHHTVAEKVQDHFDRIKQ